MSSDQNTMQRSLPLFEFRTARQERDTFARKPGTGHGQLTLELLPSRPVHEAWACWAITERALTYGRRQLRRALVPITDATSPKASRLADFNMNASV
jgi:hypothetical protein